MMDRRAFIGTAAVGALINASKPAAVTEKLLQNDFVSSNYCRKDNPLSRNDWEMAFTRTLE